MALDRSFRPERRPRRRSRLRGPPLDIAQILAWADLHFARTGRWPRQTDGRVIGSLGEKWCNIYVYLGNGSRGLPGGSSLAKLLEEHRGVRNPKHLPPLTVGQILMWADAHVARTGRWPTHESGPIADAPGETRSAVESALRNGKRGQPGALSLARVLQEHRGVRNPACVPRLTVDEILAWADAHFARTGRWPTMNTGAVTESPADTWGAIHHALSNGLRGLPQSTLPRLLEERRGVRNIKNLPPLSVTQILAWADAHFAREGRWPGEKSGPVPEAEGETWSAIAAALWHGSRGLPSGSSLPRLLAEHRGLRHAHNAPPLTEAMIRGWAETHRAAMGRWPYVRSGPIAAAPGETWSAIDAALREGMRGLPGASSLYRLLTGRRRARHRGTACDHSQ